MKFLSIISVFFLIASVSMADEVLTNPQTLNGNNKPGSLPDSWNYQPPGFHPGQPGPGSPGEVGQPWQKVTMIARMYLGHGSGEMTPVSSCFGGDQIKATMVYIKVRKQTARVDGVRIWFGNNQYQDLYGIANLYAPGSISTWYPLVGGTRCIRYVQIFGSTVSGDHVIQPPFWGNGPLIEDSLIGPGSAVEPNPFGGARAIVDVFAFRSM